MKYSMQLTVTNCFKIKIKKREYGDSSMADKECDLLQNWHMGIFRIVDYKSIIDFVKLNMADLICRTKYFVLLNLINLIWYLDVFRIVDDKSANSSRKFNLADLIWWTIYLTYFLSIDLIESWLVYEDSYFIILQVDFAM